MRQRDVGFGMVLSGIVGILPILSLTLVFPGKFLIETDPPPI